MPSANARLQVEHVVDRLSVHHRARAARVVADHAANRGSAGRRDIGGEPEPMRSEFCVQLVEHDAWLDPRPPLFDVDLEQPIEML